MGMDSVELLSPAGDMDSFVAALAAGADAVYLGLPRYSARASAKNLSKDELLYALDRAHLLEKKIYLTVNTLFKDREIEDLYDLLYEPYRNGLDGVIVQDYGVMIAISQMFSDLPIHVSTQAQVTENADELKKIPHVTRIVPARELSLEEIRKLKVRSGLELECFIHGSLCYSYSGKCLLSSFIGGRSGNRGRCAQPCRLTYDGRYPLSLKDLCTIDIIPELIDAGISSFKIEGRMKSSSYVYGVTSIYRRYIDMYLSGSSYSVDDKDRKRLISYYTRGGNCGGYYHCHNSSCMITADSPSYISDADQSAGKYDIPKIAVNIRCTVNKGKKAEISVYDTQRSVHVTCDVIPECAHKSALSKESVAKQLNKTGTSPYCIKELDIDIDDNLFIPNGKLNEIRRAGLDAFSNGLLKDHKRDGEIKQIRDPSIDHFDTPVKVPLVNAYVCDRDQLRAAIKSRVDIITVPMELFEHSTDLIKSQDEPKRLYVALPYVIRSTGANSAESVARFVRKYSDEYGINGYLVSNLESLTILNSCGYKGNITADIHLYAYNRFSHEFLKKAGIDVTTVPIELNEHELVNRRIYNEELIVYGHLPVMISANCIKNTVSRCEKSRRGHDLYITDRKGKRLFVRCICSQCTNVIYNSMALSVCDEYDLFDRLKPSSVRFMFTDEDHDKVSSVLDMYYSNRSRNGSSDVKLCATYTKGHLKRGVE